MDLENQEAGHGVVESGAQLYYERSKKYLVNQ